jgi:hypothetical protein
MPTNTTNFGLIKPRQEEFYNVDVPNANMDTIDRVLKALQDAISSGASEQDLKILRDALATHLTEIASLTNEGHVMLSNLINGSSEGKAATELAVKNAIAHVKAWGRSKITEGNLQTDPNTTDLSLILVQGHPNAPTGGIWYISTFFYYADPSNAKSQIAVSYNKDYGRGMYWRDCFGGVWQPWVKILDETMKNVPSGVAGLDGNGKLAPGASPADNGFELASRLILSDVSEFSFAGLNAYSEFEIVMNNVNYGLSDAQNENYLTFNDGVYTEGSYTGTSNVGASTSAILRSNLLLLGRKPYTTQGYESKFAAVVKVRKRAATVNGSADFWDVETNYKGFSTISDAGNSNYISAALNTGIFGSYGINPSILRKISIRNASSVLMKNGTVELWVKR